MARITIAQQWRAYLETHLVVCDDCKKSFLRRNEPRGIVRPPKTNGGKWGRIACGSCADKPAAVELQPTAKKTPILDFESRVRELALKAGEMLSWAIELTELDAKNDKASAFMHPSKVQSDRLYARAEALLAVRDLLTLCSELGED